MCWCVCFGWSVCMWLAGTRIFSGHSYHVLVSVCVCVPCVVYISGGKFAHGWAWLWRDVAGSFSRHDVCVCVCTIITMCVCLKWSICTWLVRAVTRCCIDFQGSYRVFVCVYHMLVCVFQVVSLHMVGQDCDEMLQWFSVVIPCVCVCVPCVGVCVSGGWSAHGWAGLWWDVARIFSGHHHGCHQAAVWCMRRHSPHFLRGARHHAMICHGQHPQQLSSTDCQHVIWHRLSASVFTWNCTDPRLMQGSVCYDKTHKADRASSVCFDKTHTKQTQS